MAELDLMRLKVRPLAERRSLTRVEDILIPPDRSPVPLSPAQADRVAEIAEAMRAARKAGAPVILMYGAHLIRNGAVPLLTGLMEAGFIQHLATNGAGTIHDWEYAWLGRSTEGVEENVAAGTFGTWDETGRNIHLALLAGALQGLGYGQSLGRFIQEDGCELPEPDMLAQLVSQFPADPMAGACCELLSMMARHGLAAGRHPLTHAWKHASLLAQAWRLGVPVTVHPGIGYDIISCHPMFNGAVIGRAAAQDFRSFAGAVESLDGGVVLSIGSAIMAPQVFEKSLGRCRATASTWWTSRTAAAGIGPRASRPRPTRRITSGSARASPGWEARCSTCAATTRRSSTTCTANWWARQRSRCRPSEVARRSGEAVRPIGPSACRVNVDASREVEEQHLRGFQGDDLEPFGAGDGGGIAGAKAFRSKADRAFGHVQPCMASRGQPMGRLVACLQPPEPEIDVLMDGQGILPSGMACHEMQPATRGGCHGSLRIARFQASAFRDDPDLQEVHRLVRRRVHLAVPDAGAGGHVLDIARSNDPPVAHGVAVFELSAQDVGEDLHVPVRVQAEAHAGLDHVVVDHPQRAEAHPSRVMVVGKAEGVP